MGKEEIREVWRQHLETKNEREGGRTEATRVGIKINVGQPDPQGRVVR